MTNVREVISAVPTTVATSTQMLQQLQIVVTVILFSEGICDTPVTMYIFQILQQNVSRGQLPRQLHQLHFYKHQLDNSQSTLPRPTIQVIILAYLSPSHESCMATATACYPPRYTVSS